MPEFDSQTTDHVTDGTTFNKPDSEPTPLPPLSEREISAAINNLLKTLDTLKGEAVKPSDINDPADFFYDEEFNENLKLASIQAAYLRLYFSDQNIELHQYLDAYISIAAPKVYITREEVLSNLNNEMDILKAELLIMQPPLPEGDHQPMCVCVMQ